LFSVCSLWQLSTGAMTGVIFTDFDELGIRRPNTCTNSFEKPRADHVVILIDHPRNPGQEQLVDVDVAWEIT